MATELPVIAERLRAPPFNMAHVNMVDLGQRSGHDLLQLLMDSCHAVQPKLPLAHVRKEGPEAVADRVELFLRMVSKPGPRYILKEKEGGGWVGCAVPHFAIFPLEFRSYSHLYGLIDVYYAD